MHTSSSSGLETCWQIEQWSTFVSIVHSKNTKILKANLKKYSSKGNDHYSAHSDHTVLKHSDSDLVSSQAKWEETESFGDLEDKTQGSSSTEEGEVTLPAAHLATHGGQYVIQVPSG